MKRLIVASLMLVLLLLVVMPVMAQDPTAEPTSESPIVVEQPPVVIEELPTTPPAPIDTGNPLGDVAGSLLAIFAFSLAQALLVAKFIEHYVQPFLAQAGIPKYTDAAKANKNELYFLIIATAAFGEGIFIAIGGHFNLLDSVAASYLPFNAAGINDTIAWIGTGLFFGAMSFFAHDLLQWFTSRRAKLEQGVQILNEVGRHG